MESAKQSLDTAVTRVLDALRPVLAVDLDRLIQDAHEQREDEFQKRLESAVREAQAGLQQVAEARVEQAVEEATISARSQMMQEFQNQFDQTLQETSEALKSRFEEELRATAAEWAAERAGLQDQ